MSGASVELPLFPLQAVLFPEGRLTLKIFEARYLDMVGSCMRAQRPFGVVGLEAGSEVRGAGGDVRLRPVGTLAELSDVDSAQPGILQIACRGTLRFSIESSRQQADGLWLAHVTERAADAEVAPAADHASAVKGLRDAVATLEQHGASPFLPPHRFESAGWVANRWCEILPISLDAKQLMLELADPLARLGLVDSLLRARAGRT